MVYIHKLADLGPKAAEIESVYIIRELKTKMGFPFSASKMEQYFEEYAVSPTDIQKMEASLDVLQPTIANVQSLLHANDAVFEPVNITRGLQILNTIPLNLIANIVYAKEIAGWQHFLFNDAASLLNRIPSLKSYPEKMEVNEKLNELFQKLLRNKEFQFFYSDIIHEGHIKSLLGLSDSLKEGFFFKTTFEEELRRIDFSKRKARIPTKHLADVEEIEKKIPLIRQGVERAYDVNMRMVNQAIVLHACVKYAMQS